MDVGHRLTPSNLTPLCEETAQGQNKAKVQQDCGFYQSARTNKKQEQALPSGACCVLPGIDFTQVSFVVFVAVSVPCQGHLRQHVHGSRRVVARRIDEDVIRVGIGCHSEQNHVTTTALDLFLRLRSFYKAPGALGFPVRSVSSDCSRLS